MGGLIGSFGDRLIAAWIMLSGTLFVLPVLAVMLEDERAAVFFAELQHAGSYVYMVVLIGCVVNLALRVTRGAGADKRTN